MRKFKGFFCLVGVLLLFFFLTVRVVRHRNEVPREVLGCLNRGTVQIRARWGLEHPPGGCIRIPGRGVGTS